MKIIIIAQMRERKYIYFGAKFPPSVEFKQVLI